MQKSRHNQQRRQRDTDRQNEVETSSTTTSSSPDVVVNHNILKRLFVGSPVKIENPFDFFKEYCDKKHLYIPLSDNNNNNSGQGRTSNYWEDIFHIDWSTEKMRNAVKNKKLRHRVDINIVRYDKAEKRRIDFMETMSEEKNPEAYDDSDLPPLVTLKDFDHAIKSGWSVRFLRPQEHGTIVDRPEGDRNGDVVGDVGGALHQSLSSIMFKLEEELQCSCGINSYWTPGNGQGFAPHYDDVDVFLLQLEGKKHWRLYNPPTEGDWLSRVSSEDYKPDELGKPVLDIVLKKGEMLYMPRGTVHQGDTTHVGNVAVTVAGQQQQQQQQHSLHVTLSAFQMHTWADLIRETYDYRVEFAAANNVSLRHSLPLGWRTVMGSLANPTMMGPFVMPLSAEQKLLRAEMQRTMRGFFAEVHSALMSKDGILDKGVDAIARKVLERRQPIPLVVASSSSNKHQQQAQEQQTVVENPKHIRLTFKESVRFIMLTDEVRLYHCGGNSIICLGPKQHRTSTTAKWTSLTKAADGATSAEPRPSSAAGYLRFDVSFGPALAVIVAKSPNWVQLTSLPDLCFDESDPSNASTTIPLEESRQMIDALLATCCFEVRQ